MKDEEEKRLTTDLRAFSPVFIENDSTIAYLATYDGGQDIYLLDLKSNSSTKITNFQNRPMISHLSYNKISNKIYFDITEHHFRDIYSYDINSKKIESVSNISSYDERNISFDEKVDPFFLRIRAVSIIYI